MWGGLPGFTLSLGIPAPTWGVCTEAGNTHDLDPCKTILCMHEFCPPRNTELSLFHFTLEKDPALVESPALTVFLGIKWCH